MHAFSHPKDVLDGTGIVSKSPKKYIGGKSRLGLYYMVEFSLLRLSNNVLQDFHAEA